MNKVQHVKWCMKQTKFTSEISWPTDSCLAQLVRHWPEDLEVMASMPTGGNFWLFCFALPCVKIYQIIWQKCLSWKTQMCLWKNVICVMPWCDCHLYLWAASRSLGGVGSAILEPGTAPTLKQVWQADVTNVTVWRWPFHKHYLAPCQIAHLGQSAAFPPFSL